MGTRTPITGPETFTGSALVSIETLPSGVLFVRQARRSYPATENDEQEMFCRWCTANGIEFHCIPNQAVTNKVQGANLKRVGLKKGVPDLYVVTRGPKPGCPFPVILEFKRTGSVKSDVDVYQWYWLEYWQKQGALSAVVCGFDCAKHVVGLVGLPNLAEHGLPERVGDAGGGFVPNIGKR